MSFDLVLDSQDHSYELTWGVIVPEYTSHFLTLRKGKIYHYNDISYKKDTIELMQKIIPQAFASTEAQPEITYAQAIELAEHFNPYIISELDEYIEAWEQAEKVA